MLLNSYRFGPAPVVPLLDTYSGAVAAYSCARILKTGNTNLLTVVRSSDTTAQDIGATGGVLNTASMLAFVGANNGVVSRMFNQAASGSNAIHSGPGARPTIVSSGSLVTLGTASRPSMTFTATDSLSSLTDFPNFGTSMGLDGNLAVSVFAVYRKTTATAGCLFGWGNTGVAVAAFGYYDDNVNAQVAYAGGQAYNTSVPANSTHYLLSITKAAGAINVTSSAYRNGVSVATTGHGTSVPNVAGTGPMNIGQWAGYAPNKLIGSLQEFIVFAGDKSSDRAAIEANIMSFYGI